MNGVQDGKKEKGGNGDLAGSQLFSQIERWVKKEGKKNKKQKTSLKKQKHRNINTHLRQSKLQVAAI